MQIIATPTGTKRITLDTAALLAILHQARTHHEGDMGAACAAIIESTRSALRDTRRSIRRTKSFRLREYMEQRCRRLLNSNRRVRRLAKQYGWTIPERSGA